jgi:prepilin-type N-terminal cleavage/methylation domain-containing protein
MGVKKGSLFSKAVPAVTSIFWGGCMLRGSLMRDQKGFSLIEVLLAMALVGILGVSIPSALSGANRATITTNQHTMAESLARSQMDYIQNQPYDSANITPVYALLSNIPAPYSIVTPMAQRLDPKGDGISNDDGLQRITVTVKNGSTVIFTLVDFKVNFNP